MDGLKKLFVPEKIEGYDYMINTFKSKVPALFSIIDNIKTLTSKHISGDSANWEMTLVVAGKHVKVPVVDWAPVDGLLKATRLIITAILYLWLGQYLIKAFDIKFHVG